MTSEFSNEYLQISKFAYIHEYLRILNPQVTNTRSMIETVGSWEGRDRDIMISRADPKNQL